MIPLAHVATGFPVDLVVAGPGLEDLFFERAVTMTIEGVRTVVVSAEDLIVMKVLAGRPKDLEDVASVLKARASSLDVARVRETLKLVEAALDQGDLLPQFERMLARRR